jgi:DNA-binding PadR family transcriptional regulator
LQEDEMLRGFIADMRRGTQTLSVLGTLSQPKYGYSLLQDMQSRGLQIEAGTLYPMLRRLETQGFLQSEWDTAESRPRKYYMLSERGRALYERLRTEWFVIAREIGLMLHEGLAN